MDGKTDSVFFKGFMKIGLQIYVRNWNKSEEKKEWIKRAIVEYKSCQEILSMLYGMFTYKKEILTIEEMPVDLLDDLESEAKTWCSHAEGKELQKLMQCIWAMNYLLTINDMT